jgi:RNA polymerase sigma-70 factor (ECF subfamily)
MGLKVVNTRGAALTSDLRELLLNEERREVRRPTVVSPDARSISSLPTAAEILALMREDPARGAPLFYDRFQGEVNRLVWRLLGADPDHDDVVQQVFVTALRRVAMVRDPEKLLPWVRTVAVNAVYDEVRKRRVRRIFLRDAAREEVHPSLVHDVEVRDFLLKAKRVLDMMPAAERMVFLLHILEGRGLHEIAELCSCSVATAKRRLARAHRRFDKLAARNPDLLRLLQREHPVEVGPGGDESEGGDS